MAQTGSYATTRLPAVDPSGSDPNMRSLRDCGEGRDQCRRRTNEEVHLAPEVPHAGHHLAEFAGGRLDPIHLPVAGDQRPDGVSHVQFHSAEMNMRYQSPAGSSRCQLVNRLQLAPLPEVAGGFRPLYDTASTR